MSRARLVLSAEETRIRELWLEAESTLELASTRTRLVIRDRWVDRGRVIGTQAGSSSTAYVLGDQVLLERPVRGVNIIAPKCPSDGHDTG